MDVINSSSSKISFVLSHKAKSILIMDDCVCRSNEISTTMKYHPCGNRMRSKSIRDLNDVLLKINGNHSFVIDIEKQRNSNVQANYQIKCYQSMLSYTKYIRRSNENDSKIRDDC